MHYSRGTVQLKYSKVFQKSEKVPTIEWKRIECSERYAFPALIDGLMYLRKVLVMTVLRGKGEMRRVSAD